MDDITASIIVTCQTEGATAAINKLRFGFMMLTREAFNFSKDLVNEFRTSQDAAWKFGKTFSATMGSAENAVRDFRNEYKLADSTARNMLTDTAGLLQGMGFAERDTLEMAKEISRMGVDLASFTGYMGGAQGATDAIISSLMGENEKLKGLRIVIREDSDEFRKMTQQIATTKGVTDEYAKALAKLELIKQKSKPAQGDYKAPGENFTQSINNMGQAVKQLKSYVGEIIYEGLRLNDVFSSMGGALFAVGEQWRREKEVWIHLMRDFTVDLVAGVKISLLPFAGIWAEISNGYKNIFNLGQWFFENWGKLWGNATEIVKAAFLDIFEYAKLFFGPSGIFPQMFATIGTSLVKAVKEGIMGGGDIKKILADSWGEFWDKTIIAGVAKQGANLDKALAKAQIKPFEFTFSGWNYAQEHANIKADAILGHRAEEERFLERIKVAQGKGPQKGKEGAPLFGVSLGADLAKELFKYRSTAQSAIDANSAEGWRLRTRRLTDPGANPQLSAANSLKHLEQQITDTNTKLEEMKRELRALTSGGAKITVSAKKY